MERRPWTTQQDELLKNLYQKIKLNKWSLIARHMQSQFSLAPRTGKQCRERYNNHLNPLNLKESWTPEQQQELLRLHDELGNKWAVIAVHLGGRTDNGVKNHFFAKLRKAMRRINKIIQQQYRKQLREIKLNILYKIVQASEEKFKKNPLCSAETSKTSCALKNQILKFSHEDYAAPTHEFVSLMQRVHEFARQYKRKPKQLRRVASQGLEIPDQTSDLGQQRENSSLSDSQDQIVRADNKLLQPKQGANQVESAENKIFLRSKNIILVQPTEMMYRSNIEDLLHHQGILQEQNSPLPQFSGLVRRSTSSEYNMESSQREHFYLQQSLNDHNLPTPVFDHSCKKQSHEQTLFK